MNGRELARVLAEAGLKARVDGAKVLIGPKGLITPELEALIKAGRKALRQHLLAGPGGDEARADELASYVEESLANAAYDQQYDDHMAEMRAANPHAARQDVTAADQIDEAERAAKLEAAEGLDPFGDHPALHRIVWERVSTKVSPLGWVARLAEPPPRRWGR